jgi:phosphatidylglycerol:prolipoprotein diacylglycerol transferase
VFLVLRRRRILSGQHFHLYLIAYGLFRFWHEYMRATPRLHGGITGYQIAALSVAGLGILGFVRRRHAQSDTPVVPAATILS